MSENTASWPFIARFLSQLASLITWSPRKVCSPGRHIKFQHRFVQKPAAVPVTFPCPDRDMLSFVNIGEYRLRSEDRSGANDRKQLFYTPQPDRPRHTQPALSSYDGRELGSEQDVPSRASERAAAVLAPGAGARRQVSGHVGSRGSAGDFVPDDRGKVVSLSHSANIFRHRLYTQGL